jgi:hypothetical protein
MSKLSLDITATLSGGVIRLDLRQINGKERKAALYAVGYLGRPGRRKRLVANIVLTHEGILTCQPIIRSARQRTKQAKSALTKVRQAARQGILNHRHRKAAPTQPAAIWCQQDLRALSASQP